MGDQFCVVLTDEAKKTVQHLNRRDQRKAKKVAKALKLLREHGPRYPGLNSHRIVSFKGPYGETWESYVENRTPGAWRIFWHYGPNTGVITVFLIREHLS